MRIATVCLAWLAASPLWGQAGLPQAAFEKHTLPNGLQVILHVDRKLPVVNVNIWYHVGSKNERPGCNGFAHLFEHMMFEGSRNVFRAGVPQALLQTGITGIVDRFEVTGDGKRFLASLPAKEPEGNRPLTVVQNWLAGVKK